MTTNETTTNKIYRRGLTLAQKLIFSYAAIGFFSLTSLLISLYGLFSLAEIVTDIAKKDVASLTEVDRLRETILSQQRVAGKYLILKDPEFSQIYRQNEQRFLSLLLNLQRQPKSKAAAVVVAYDKFRREADRQFAIGDLDAPRLKKAADEVSASLDDLYRERRLLLEKRMADADAQHTFTVNVTLVLSFAGFLIAVAVATFFVYNISRGFAKLKAATHRIAAGDFDFDPGIPATDEFGELANDFVRMAGRLKVLEQISLDASPLTRLPGNIAIERALNRRLRDLKPFALAYADLDNFKPYNDRYGYVQASEVIKMTGEIIFGAVKQCGDSSDFVGHIGGDDFVMIIGTERIAEICERVISDFTEKIRGYYSDEDLAAGAIVGHDRYGVERTFPILTISIAVLQCAPGDFSSAADIAKAAAEIKDRVKVAPGSNYFIHRGGV